MNNEFRHQGYTFREISSTNPHRPYKVLCLETGDTKDSALSYIDAANLIISAIRFAEAKLESDSKDIDYVRKIFEGHLIGRKNSDCKKIIIEEIQQHQLVKGYITILPENEKFSKELECHTEHFKIKILFERSLFCGATKIVIDNK